MYRPLQQLFARTARIDRRRKGSRRPKLSFQTSTGHELEPRRLLAVAPLPSGVVAAQQSNAAYVSTVSVKAAATPVGAASVTLPKAPLNIQATAGKASVALQWGAPGWDGGGQIFDYRIQYSSNNGTTWAVFPDGTSTRTNANVTGLLNGTAYIFRVSAINSAGFGSPATTSSVTTGTVPAAPTRLGVAVSLTQTTSTSPTNPYRVEISWTAPPVVRGAGVAGYLVQQSSDNGKNWSTVATTNASTTTARLDSLSGEACLFRVAATNSFGQSSFCQARAPVAPGDQLLAIPGNRQVSLAWTTSFNGSSVRGITLRGFAIEYKVASPAVTRWTKVTSYDDVSEINGYGERSPRSTSAVVTGLTNGVSYVFRVTGVLTNGVTISMPSMFPATTPNASGFRQPAMPQIVLSVASNRQVTLSLQPVATGGTPITGYLVSYMKLTGDWKTMRWTTTQGGPSSGPLVVSDLDNGSQYVFKVAALNAVGAGLFSAVSAPVTPSTIPFLLGPLNVTLSDDTFQPMKKVATLSFSVSEIGGSPITQYQYQFSTDGKTWGALPSAAISAGRVATGSRISIIYVDKLPVGARYWFRFAAANAVGTSNWITGSA